MIINNLGLNVWNYNRFFFELNFRPSTAASPPSFPVHKRPQRQLPAGQAERQRQSHFAAFLIARINFRFFINYYCHKNLFFLRSAPLLANFKRNYCFLLHSRQLKLIITKIIGSFLWFYCLTFSVLLWGFLTQKSTNLFYTFHKIKFSNN